MKHLSSASLIVALLIAWACQRRRSERPAGRSRNAAAAAVAPILTTPDAVDTHSYAKPLEARVSHVALDLASTSIAKRIGGTATLDIDRKPDARQIVLDDKGLEIQRSPTPPASRSQFKSAPVDKNLGAPLVDRASARHEADRHQLQVRARCRARLLWLTPEQTAGKKHPFMFSQGESIENRTWIPTQDSPGIRQSWEARISVPAADRGDVARRDPTQPIDPGRRAHLHFPHGPQRRALHDRDCGRRPGLQAARPAHRRVDRAGDARRGRARACRYRENGRRGGEALRPLSLGPLRRARPAAILSVRRHGKSRR